ncbi:sulfurtransferase [Ohtaekwangia sp.]|uniref:sulfurtransferase n=1 Tax=Ohtaekwangia sp. TaxID=2066019 RepID=UPI002FDCBA9B
MYIIKSSDVPAYREQYNPIVIDARGGPDAYSRYVARHLEGAQFVDLETQLSQKTLNAARGGRHPLLDMKSFSALLGKLGITPGTHVLVYDDKAGANAASRFWWMLKSVGHKYVQVVSGGLDAMEKAGIPITTDILSAAAVAPYPIPDIKLPVVDVDTVTKAVKDTDALVIDVREAYRYRGESEPIDLIAGHIPGAVNVPFITNLDASGQFLPAEQLAEKYGDVIGSRAPENVIVHCGSGVTACHTLLALEEAGIPGAKLYVGSWSEWSRNDYPIATGENP